MWKNYFMILRSKARFDCIINFEGGKLLLFFRSKPLSDSFNRLYIFRRFKYSKFSPRTLESPINHHAFYIVIIQLNAINYRGKTLPRSRIKKWIYSEEDILVFQFKTIEKKSSRVMQHIER